MTQLSVSELGSTAVRGIEVDSDNTVTHSTLSIGWSIEQLSPGKELECEES